MTNFTSRTKRLTRAGIAAFAVCTSLVAYTASAPSRK